MVNNEIKNEMNINLIPVVI